MHARARPAGISLMLCGAMFVDPVRSMVSTDVMWEREGVAWDLEKVPY